MTDDRARVAVVSGGARGIGRAIVDRLLVDGWEVHAVDVNERAVDELAGDADRSGGRLAVHRLSIVDRPAVERLAADLTGAGSVVGALVNNAGMTLPATFLDQTDDDWERIVDVNLKGTFVMSQVFARAMVGTGGGSIVHISSISAHGTRTGPPAYAAAKAGVEGLSRLIADQLGRQGVRSNTVVVGTVATEGLLRRKSAEQLAAMEASTRTGTLGRPDDVAETVAFLCSDASRHVTGQLLSVSGGQWMP